MAPKSFGTAVSHILSCVPYGNSFGNFTIETPGLASNSFSAGHGGTGKKSKLWGKEGPSAVAIRMPRAWQVHSGPQGFPLKANTRSWFSLPFLQTESLSCLVYSQSGCPVDPRSSMVCEKLSFPCRLFLPNRRQRFASGLSFCLLLAHTALLPLTGWQTT